MKSLLPRECLVHVKFVFFLFLLSVHLSAADAQPVPLLDRAKLAATAKSKFENANILSEVEKAKADLALNPGNERDWARLSWAQLAAEQFDAAESSALTALRIRPYHARYNAHLARCLLANGKPGRVPLFLARAQQCNIPPYNQLAPYEIMNLLADITDEATRAQIGKDYLSASKRNTFDADVPRLRIMQEATPFGKIISTQRAPLNKARLWLLFDKHFVQVYDEDLRTFDEKLFEKLPAEFRNATPVSLIFNTSKVIVACREGLLLHDTADYSWSRINPPPDAANPVILSASLLDNAAFLDVLFDKTGLWRYDLAKQTWQPVKEQPEVSIPNDPGAADFVKARCQIPDPSSLALNVAVQQWNDLKAYLTLIQSKLSAEQAVTDGKIKLEPLETTARRDGAPESAPNKALIIGMTCPAWHANDFTAPTVDRALADFHNSNIKWVAAVTTGYQNDPYSLKVAADPEKTAPPEELERFIKSAHDRGQKVMLKVHVNLAVEEKDNHVWRGLICPLNELDVDAWFASYEKFLMRYVDVGIRQHVELMTVGVELKSLTHYQSHWRALIATIRKRGYTGKLTYCSLHDDFNKIAFWDALDYIGIDAYFSLSSSEKPKLDDFISGWLWHVQRLENFSKSKGKPILFTELGFNNLKGASNYPWHWVGSSKDLNNLEQALCYHASFSVLTKQKWFAGMFWWTWDLGEQVLPDKANYSPQNKLAQLILESYLKEK